MVQITASMVKELREITGLGMMECKKALAEANGDMKAAEDLLRIKSGAKASKIAGRIAAEGAVGAYVSPGGKTAALVEVNCETDFVAKDVHFADFVAILAQRIAQTNPANNEELAEIKLDSGETVECTRKALVMKLGENISVRRFARVQTTGHVASYLHGNKIGVLVDYQGGDEVLGKDLAMHIAASKPLCLSKQQVPAEVIAKEREIYKAQAAESGKPANIIEKMVEGKIAKYLAEITLLGQPFVKDPEQTVEKLLSVKSAKVNAFHLFVVGEGIKKKNSDFVAEVMAQAGRA
ncbi:MAG: translation elongation factor Ts [Burkholderiales bacterium]